MSEEHAGLDMGILCDDLSKAAKAHGFDVSEYGRCDHNLPLLAFRRVTGEDLPYVYLSAGMHGDEPAGPLTVLKLLKDQNFTDQVNWYICPAMNPVGLLNKSRYSQGGRDLNRDYKDCKAFESKQHTEWLKACCPRFDFHLSLHEDWEAKGFYIYEVLEKDFPSLATEILEAAKPYCGIDLSESIDWFEAQGGIISPPLHEEDLATIPYWPQAIYLVANGFGGNHYTFETPSSRAIDQRIAAQEASFLAAMQGFLKARA
tara:strand:- start:2402 stop:3178 length:777 start_codon:yes stop_codon:yes gene_type:complete